MRIDFDVIVRISKKKPNSAGPMQTEELLKMTIAGPRQAVEKVIESIEKVAELV